MFANKSIQVLAIFVNFIASFFISLATFLANFHNDFIIILLIAFTFLELIHFSLFKFGFYNVRQKTLLISTINFVLLVFSFALTIYYYNKLPSWGLVKTKGVEDDFTNYPEVFLALFFMAFTLLLWILLKKLLKKAKFQS